MSTVQRTFKYFGEPFITGQDIGVLVVGKGFVMIPKDEVELDRENKEVFVTEEMARMILRLS